MKINNSSKQWPMAALKATFMPVRTINKANYKAMRRLMLLKLCSCRPLFFVVATAAAAAVVLLASISLWLPWIH